MKREFDFIIVGQGLAGTMLYWFLHKAGKSVFIIDAFNPNSASNIAAGIIHPVTGRRIVKTWMADTLIPFAESTYGEIESELGVRLFLKQDILELLRSAKEINDWNTKISADEMQGYFGEQVERNMYHAMLAGNPSKITVTNSGWLNLAVMINSFRRQLSEKKLLSEEKFDFNQLEIVAGSIRYKNFTAGKLIFCDGYQSIHNPFWNHLPFLPSKGELLTIHAPTLELEHIVVNRIFILPLGNHLFRVGSTYSWDELNETATTKAREELTLQLDKIISVPYEVVDQKAGIRPTVKDRRPFIGLHAGNLNVGIFNGLGTKGVLLAPYFANHFAQHLVHNKELLNEVDVKRFNPG